MACTKISPLTKQCFVTLTVVMNMIGHGVVLGYPGILLPQLHQKDSPIFLSKTADSWLASLLSITLPLGNLIITSIMGPFGRKTAHYIVSTFAIIGWITTFFANSVEALLVGDIFQGLSFGMMLSLVCIMIGEYSSPKNRGAFLTTPSFSQGLGIFIVHFIGSYLNWRYTALVSAIFPLTSLIMTIFIPESPSWLAVKGRYEECKKEFRWLRGPEEDAELEAMIQARKDFDKAKTRGDRWNFILIIKKKEVYKPLILTVHIYLLGLLSSSTIMNPYVIKIITLIMNPEVNAKGWMIGLDALRITISILSMYIIYKVPRRTMMFTTGGLCLFSHIATTTYVFFRNFGILTYQVNWLPGVLITLQSIFAAIGILQLIAITAGEVFPLEYRSIADSITMLISSLLAFISLKTFLIMVDSIGIEGVYTVYIGLMTYSLTVIWFLMPETKGKTLLEIENEFVGKTSRMEDMEQRESLKIEEKQYNQ